MSMCASGFVRHQPGLASPGAKSRSPWPISPYDELLQSKILPTDADETVAGNQASRFIGTAPFTAPGQINWFTNGPDTFIQLNTNADPTVDGIMQVLGVHTVDASWFVL